MDSITAPRFFDAHVHFRFGPMLRLVAPITAAYCCGAVVMPNRRKERPILNGVDLKNYEREIIQTTEQRFPWFSPFMVVQLTRATTIADLESAHEAGCRAIKIFPKSVSNSEFGVDRYQPLAPQLKFAERYGMHVLLHGEHPNPFIDTMNAEAKFTPIVRWMVKRFPNLKITLEHISTRAGLGLVRELYPNVAGTLTVHHMIKSMNDVIKQKVRPHNFCMPVLKFRRDMHAIHDAALGEEHCFMYGGDSAPHRRHTKECAEGCAGVFNAPVQYQTLAEEYDKAKAWENWEPFTSRRALDRYGLPRPEKKVTLVRHQWQVPSIINGVVPFRAGETITWQFKDLVA